MTTKDYTLFTNSKILDETIESLKEKILDQDENIEWKIYLTLANQDTSNSREHSSSQQLELQRSPANSLSYPSRNEQPCEKLIREQRDQIKILAQEKELLIISAEKTELKLSNEVKNLNETVKKLKKSLAKAEDVANVVDNIKLRENDIKSSREKLLIDKFNLIKKLQLTELRLKLKEAELSSLTSKEGEAKIKNATADISRILTTVLAIPMDILNTIAVSNRPPKEFPIMLENLIEQHKSAPSNSADVQNTTTDMPSSSSSNKQKSITNTPSSSSSNAQKNVTNTPKSSSSNVQKNVTNTPNSSSSNVQKTLTNMPNSSSSNAQKTFTNMPSSSSSNVQKTFTNMPSSSSSNVRKISTDMSSSSSSANIRKISTDRSNISPKVINTPTNLRGIAPRIGNFPINFSDPSLNINNTSKSVNDISKNTSNPSTNMINTSTIVRNTPANVYNTPMTYMPTYPTNEQNISRNRQFGSAEEYRYFTDEYSNKNAIYIRERPIPLNKVPISINKKRPFPNEYHISRNEYNSNTRNIATDINTKEHNDFSNLKNDYQILNYKDVVIGNEYNTSRNDYNSSAAVHSTPPNNQIILIDGNKTTTNTYNTARVDPNTSKNEYNTPVSEYNTPKNDYNSPMDDYDCSMNDYDTSTNENNVLTTTRSITRIASLGSLADTLLKSSRQSEHRTLITPLPSTAIKIERSPEPTRNDMNPAFIKEASVIRKPKAIKLTYRDQWTPSEDKLLLDTVRKEGVGNWGIVSKQFLYRSSSECFRRFNEINSSNHLN